jgi:hypothetical protein
MTRRPYDRVIGSCPACGGRLSRSEAVTVNGRRYHRGVCEDRARLQGPKTIEGDTMTDEKSKAAKGEEPEAEEWGDDQAAFLPTWSYNDNGPLIGTIESMRTVPDVQGLGGEARDVPIFTIVTDEGERFSQWGTGMLARVLPDLVGQRVKIEDRGLEPQPGGTSLRIFDVRVAKS